MLRAMIWGRIAIGVAAIIGGAMSPPAAAQTASAPEAEATAPEAEAPRPIPPDPAARIGQLPNGMRYVIMANATPPGAASLRLRIGAGSLIEQDDQRGLAHFIEHLALNETRNVPEGELIRILERAGLSFGPDTNATTDFDQTVYMLDLPRTDAETIDTGLFLMREVASEATLREAVIEGERGVLLAEERARATPILQVDEDELAFLFRGDRLGDRMPIGRPEVIRTARRERLAALYDGYYRPERATLIAVGDFDAAAMERKVRERFGDWRGRGPAGPDLPALESQDRAGDVRIFQREGMPTRVALTWTSPAELGPDTTETRGMRAFFDVAMAALLRRLNGLAGADGPFIGATTGFERVAGRAEVAQVAAITRSGEWESAVQALEQELRRAAEHGFSEFEVDRAIGSVEGRYRGAVAEAATRPTPTLATAIVEAVNEGRVVSTPATNLAVFEEAAERIGPEILQGFFRELQKERPLVHLVTGRPVAGGEAAVRRALEASRGVAVAALEAEETVTWPYADFGAAGAVVERRAIDDLGVTLVRFANGVRLTIKPTTFTDDSVVVAARFGRGVRDLPADAPTPVWTLPLNSFTGGGLGRIAFEDIRGALSDHSYSVEATLDEGAFILSGSTRPESVGAQLQLLAAYFVDPAWRPRAYDRVRALSETIEAQLMATPDGVFQRDFGSLVRGGDPRWATPGRQRMEATPIEALSAIMEPGLASGPIEIIMVGEVEVDAAIAQVAKSFGALPSRGPAAQRPFAPVRLAGPGQATLTHRGRADQALAAITWPTADFYADSRRSWGLTLLARLFQLRLTEEVRERQGVAYSPVAAHDPSLVFPGVGYLVATIQAPPAAIGPFYASAAEIARSLREQAVSADELERARRPLIEALQRSRSSNDWWLGQLAGLWDGPRRADALRAEIAETRRFTAAELQRLARDYLVDGKVWRLSVLPAAPGGSESATPQ